MAQGWGCYLGTFAAKTGVKAALNFVAPGSGAIMDFCEAACDFYNGDIIGGSISIASGVADLVSFGVLGNLMKQSAKKAVVDTAKNWSKSASKEATKKVGKALSKEIAKGTVKAGEKEVAIQVAKGAAKTATKKATKEVGRTISVEIARGVISDSVKDVFRESGKITMANVAQNAFLASISSGGKQIPKACSEAIFSQVGEQVLFGIMATQKKEIVYQFTKEATKTAAENEFKKHTVKLFVKDFTIALAKGGNNTFGKMNEDYHTPFDWPYNRIY